MKVLTQAQLNKWLHSLSQELDLIAPVQIDDKLVYRKLEPGDSPAERIAWGFERTAMSPKTWLFPATEPILTVDQGTETTLHTAALPAPRVVFGVRPCDARGALAIDALFLNKDPADGQYARHRQATTLVGLACPQMWETCFCTAVGGAPNSTEGLDILLTEFKGASAAEPGHPSEYAAQVLTEKGEKLAAGMPGEERQVDLPSPELKADLPVLAPSGEWSTFFDDLFWQRLADRCLGCRICTFVCPTCRCFDVRDEVVSRQPGRQVFERLRAWDACTVSAYRRIAGGHNPRPTQHSRLRNRFYCKFMYYPEDFGPLGCVGCGRCIDACPVGIDILEVLAAAQRMAISR